MTNVLGGNVRKIYFVLYKTWKLSFSFFFASLNYFVFCCLSWLFTKAGSFLRAEVGSQNSNSCQQSSENLKKYVLFYLPYTFNKNTAQRVLEIKMLLSIFFYCCFLNVRKFHHIQSYSVPLKTPWTCLSRLTKVKRSLRYHSLEITCFLHSAINSEDPQNQSSFLLSLRPIRLCLYYISMQSYTTTKPLEVYTSTFSFSVLWIDTTNRSWNPSVFFLNGRIYAQLCTSFHPK